MDDISWTYGSHPTVSEWFAQQCSLNEEECPEYQLSSPADTATLHRYLTSDWPAQDAAIELVAVNDARPLRDIYDPPDLYGRAGLQCWFLSALIHDLPQTHTKISELVEAVQNVKDGELGLNEAQMREACEWGKTIRLGEFWRILNDCDRVDTPVGESRSLRIVHHSAYKACDAARKGTRGALDYDYSAMARGLETDKNTIAAYVPESMIHYEMEIKSAIYWLMRAGHLAYKSLGQVEAIGHTDYLTGNGANTTSILQSRWTLWKTRMGETARTGDLEPETRDMAQAALKKMEEIAAPNEIR